MIDITHKKTSLREATAQAIVQLSSQEAINAVKNNTVPKGNVLEMAKTAGLFAVKRTHDMIPDCHPIPVEYTGVDYKIEDLKIIIEITVKAIYRTGMEVEAMHGASVVALTMYDMLKPIDKKIEIQQIKLLHKSGGKSDLKQSLPKNLKIAILYISNKVKEGLKEDTAALKIKEKIASLPVSFHSYSISGESEMEVHDKVHELVMGGVHLILTLGGTGLSKSDQTIKNIDAILDRKLYSLIHSMSNYGLSRNYKSLVSQPLAGMIGETIIVCLPGSVNGACDTFDAIMPECLYLFKSTLSKA